MLFLKTTYLSKVSYVFVLSSQEFCLACLPLGSLDQHTWNGSRLTTCALLPPPPSITSSSTPHSSLPSHTQHPAPLKALHPVPRSSLVSSLSSSLSSSSHVSRHIPCSKFCAPAQPEKSQLICPSASKLGPNSTSNRPA